jgi:hypothetical protein
MYNQSNPFYRGQFSNYNVNYVPSTQPVYYKTIGSNNFSSNPTSNSYLNNNVNNQYRSAASFAPSMTRGFGGLTNPIYSSSLMGNKALGGLSSLFSSPIGVPQSNGFIPRFGGALGGLAGKGLGSRLSGLTWSKVFGGIQSTVTTVNQVMPLYQQIKPIFTNGKIALKMMRAAKSINAQEAQTQTVETKTEEVKKDGIPANEVIDVTPKDIFKEEVKIDLSPKTTPNKPFFVE